ncbi:MAG TPA: zf-HC2 domain-containing protein [Gemmatimonadales bacterium]|nr:zf-HC2 domain-containing protein [Gemmatimonadales bacterium]
MRHIPEEELHAYLDQGLSRSQCVEIESHLASCPSCQAARDGIAALRDRTTALLARLAPPRSFAPSFEALQRRAAVQASARRRRIHRAAWAASVVAAVGLGWTGSYLLTPRPLSPAPVASPSPASARSTTSALTVSSANVRPSRTREAPAVRRAVRRAEKPAAEISPAESLPPVVPAPTLELSSIDIPRGEFELELDGVWRTMSWDGAQAETGDELPHIDGLPVVQVQLQASEHGKRPLMVVAQQLASGEVIRTIEGPMTDVSHLLARRTMSDPDPTADTTDDRASKPKPGEKSKADRTMAMQRGDRMLVITGALPQDSLLAMIRRLNAEMRSK